MHFRLRKNVIQLIRTTYDESKKKGNSTIIGTVKLAQPELSDELRLKMTSDEIADFGVWLNTQHKTDRLREELAALTLADNIALAEKWFEREHHTDAAQIAAHDIIFQFQLLRRMLTKKELA